LGVLICLGLYYSPYFNGAARAKILGTAKALTFFFASTSIAGIFADFLKPLFGRARPKLLFADDLSGFHPMTFGSDWASMPSGHTTTVFAVAAALMVFFPRARYLLLIFAVTVGLSRVMVNAHYLSDVLFGAVIGWYVAQATRLWFEQKGMLGVGKMAPNP
jgi:undecaprenyl-diphosphatase